MKMEVKKLARAKPSSPRRPVGRPRSERQRELEIIENALQQSPMIAGYDSTEDCTLINSLARGLRVLEVFGNEGQRLANKDVANLTGIPKPSVSRLTHTLLKLHYLDQDSETGLYRLGHAALSLGFSQPKKADLASVALPFLQTFARTHAIDVTLAVLDGLEARAISFSAGTGPGLFPVMLAASVELDNSGLGLALLAGLPDQARDDLCRAIEVDLGDAWPKAQVRIARALEEYRQYGAVTLIGDALGRANSLSTSLSVPGSSDRFSISCGGLAEKVSPARLDEISPYFVGLVSTIQAGMRKQP